MVLGLKTYMMLAFLALALVIWIIAAWAYYALLILIKFSRSLMTWLKLHIKRRNGYVWPNGASYKRKNRNGGPTW